jgi:hypothetical protein
MVHQEDMGMHREMAKMAFRRGIWSFIQKMDLHLRQYAKHQSHFDQGVNAVSLAHKVPLLFIPTIFSFFRLLGNSHYVQMCFLGHCNCKLLLATKLTRAQHEDYGNATMLHCGLLHSVLLSLCQEVDFPIWVFRRGEFNMS